MGIYTLKVESFADQDVIDAYRSRFSKDALEALDNAYSMKRNFAVNVGALEPSNPLEAMAQPFPQIDFHESHRNQQPKLARTVPNNRRAKSA